MAAKGRVPNKDSYQYIVGLEESLGNQLGMPDYIQGSHNVTDESVGALPRSRLRLGEGDVLVSKGRAAFQKSGNGRGGRYMLIHFWASP